MVASPDNNQAQRANASGRKRQIGNAFRRVIDTLDRRRIRFVVIGARAVGVYVPKRTTEDLDLLVAEGDSHRVLASADKHFERARSRRGDVTVLCDPRCGAEIHIREAVDKSDVEALASTIRVKLFARKVHIPAPEYLVVMKLASMRGQRKHWEDIIALIRADCIDVRFVIAHLVREHRGLIDLFLELVTQATPKPKSGPTRR